jgi:hypothetical protein
MPQNYNVKFVALTGAQLKALRSAAGRVRQPVNLCQSKLAETRPGFPMLIAGLTVRIDRHQCSNTARWVDELTGQLVCGAHANREENTHHDHPTPFDGRNIRA